MPHNGRSPLVFPFGHYTLREIKGITLRLIINGDGDILNFQIIDRKTTIVPLDKKPAMNISSVMSEGEARTYLHCIRHTIENGTPTEHIHQIKFNGLSAVYHAEITKKQGSDNCALVVVRPYP